MTIPKASDEMSSSQPELFCVNCGDNLGDNSRGVHAFQSFINNAPARIFVEAAIKEIYRLNDRPDFKFRDDCVLCVHCCLLFSQMFGLFRLFEDRRNPEGLLATCCSSSFRNPALTENENFVQVQVTETEGAGGEGVGQVAFLEVELLDEDEDDKVGCRSSEGNKEVEEKEEEEEDEKEEEEEEEEKEEEEEEKEEEEKEEEEKEEEEKEEEEKEEEEKEEEENLDRASLNVEVDSDSCPAHFDEDEDDSLNGPDDVEESEGQNAEPFCPKGAKQDDPMVSKICSGGRELIFQCPDCSKSFKQAVQLRTHRISVHNSGEFPNRWTSAKRKSVMQSFAPNTKPKKITKSKKPESARCWMCDINFSSPFLLRKHRLEVHINPPQSTSRDHARVQSSLELSSNGDIGKEDVRRDEEVDGQESADPEYVLGPGYSSSEMEEEEDEASGNQWRKLPPSSCSNWSKQYLSRKSFAKYQKAKRRRNPTYECDFCPSVFARPRPFILHLRKHNIDSQPHKIAFQCEDCKLLYDSVTAYDKHRQEDHGELERPFKCPIALKRGDLLQKTRSHIQNFNKREVFKRSNIYRDHNRLNKQLETHEKKPFICEICDATFPYPWALTRHVTNKHTKRPMVAPDDDPSSSQDNSDVEDIQINQDPATRLFSCFQCFGEFVTRTDCRFHLKTAHPELMRFECEICNKKFSSMNSWKVHQRIHQAAESEHCNYVSNSLNVQQHAKRVHQSAINEKKRLDARAERLMKENEQDEEREPAVFKCADCDQSFKANSLLVSHRAEDHPDQERFKCPHCLKVFDSGSKLRIHIRSHDEGKDWPCGECSLRFLERLPRNQHLEEVHGVQKAQDDWMPLPPATTLQHSLGEFSKSEKALLGATTSTKRFQCPECDEEFIFPINLGHHRVIVHGANHSKLFKCNHCPWISASVLSYMNHIERHGNCGTATKHLCSDCGKCFPNRSDLTRHVALTHDKVPGPD